MIDLKSLIANPPEGLDEIVALPEQGTRADTLERCQRVVAEAVLTSGLGQDATTALLVGCAHGRLVEAVASGFPSLRNVVILEPDARMIRAIQLSPPASVGPGLERCFVADVLGGPEGYNAEAYLALISFCFTHLISPSRCVCLVDPGLEERCPGQTDALLGPALDLVRDFSARFMKLACSTDNLADYFVDEGQAPADWTFRRWADFLHERGERYHALKFYTLLQHIQHDERLATRMFESLLGLECPPLARQALDSMTTLKDKQRGKMERQLRKLQQSIDRGQARTRDANMAHLQTSFPELVKQLEDTSTDGLFSLRIQGVTSKLHPGPQKASRTARHNPQRPPYPLQVRLEGGLLSELNPPPDLLEWIRAVEKVKSIDHGHACIGAAHCHASLQNVIEHQFKTDLPRWVQCLYVLAPDLAALKVALKQVDYRPLLDPSRVELFHGPDTEDRCVAYFQRHMERAVPRLHITMRGPFKKRVMQLTSERYRLADEEMRTNRLRHNRNFTHRVLEKLRKDEPLKIWLWTSIHTTVLQHVTQDLADAFRRLGHDARVLVEKDEREQLQLPSLVKAIGEFRPDCVVLLDHLRPEYGALIPPEVPVLTWVLDDLVNLSTPDYTSKLTGLDLAFVAVADFKQKYSDKCGYPHVEVLRLAANTRTYSPRGDVEAQSKVVYPTHLSWPQEPSYAKGLYKWLYEALLQEFADGVGHRANHFQWMNKGIAELGLQIPPDKRADLRYQALMIKRHLVRVRYADAMLNHGIPFSVYGQGWEKIERFKPHARGLAMPGQELRRVYESHAAVLHVGLSPHIRVLEALATGTLTFCQYPGWYKVSPQRLADPGVQERLASKTRTARRKFDLFLDSKSEVCLFTDAQDMAAKMRTALDDAAWRQGIVDRGRARVLRDHGYESRAKTMLTSLKQQLDKVLSQEDCTTSSTDAGHAA